MSPPGRVVCTYTGKPEFSVSKKTKETKEDLKQQQKRNLRTVVPAKSDSGVIFCLQSY